MALVYDDLMTSTDGSQFLEDCKRIATAAGRLILTHHPHDVATQRKTDGSPVTRADEEADALITQALEVLTPDIPIVSEEGRFAQHGAYERFWLVDPLDGTESYKRGEPEFTVNIALIDHGAPVLGVIYDPSHHQLYWAAAGQGAWRDDGAGAARIHTRSIAAGTPLRLIKSRRKPSAGFLQKIAALQVEQMQLVSSSIKFCRVAEGSTDLYPRFGSTMEWDTAAGHAILKEAGGCVLIAGSQNELTYGKPGYHNPHFMAWGTLAQHASM